MKKIMISLAVVAMSFAMAAGAQTQDDQSLKINNVKVSAVQVQEKTQTISGTAAESKTQTKEVNGGLKTGIKNAIKAGQEKVTEVKNKLNSGKAASSEAVKEAKDKVGAEKEVLKTKSSEVIKEAKDKAEAAKEALKAKAEILKDAAKVKKEKEQERLKAEKEAFKTKIEAAKEEIKIKREQEKEILKTKLQVVKDEAKKATVQKLDENMNKLNSNFVEKLTKNLSDFDAYLSRLADKAGAAAISTTSKDMTAFNSAVESARTAIVSARAAVEIQAKKTYSIAVSTEANLKSDVSSVRNTLNADLKSVKDLVLAAHSATVKALNEFNKIKIK